MVDRGPGELARTARSALTLQATLLLRATQLRASVLHVDRENNYTACAMHIYVCLTDSQANSMHDASYQLTSI